MHVRIADPPKSRPDNSKKVNNIWVTGKNSALGYGFSGQIIPKRSFIKYLESKVYCSKNNLIIKT
jgi:hypothetical protein